jgi:CRP/FNR family transcriptional regulator
MRSFPALARLPEVEARLLANAVEVAAPRGTVLFRPGDPCPGYLLVAQGSVRVSRISATGRVVVLYHVGMGESCILTTACLLSGSDYDSTEAVVEQDVRGIQLAADGFHRALAESSGFREFVFRSFGQRILDLSERVDNLAFHPVAARLAQVLLTRCDRDGKVVATHQELAEELGSAREVVGRQLKAFAGQGWLQVERGAVQLLDTDALGELAV